MGDVLAIGALIAAALVLGRIAAMVHVPRVTGYLVAGALLGPSFAHLAGLPPVLNAESLVRLRFLSQIALGIIVFSVGWHLRFEPLRKWGGRLTYVVAGNVLVAWLLVGFATWIAGAPPAVALLLGIAAAETAPAATLMVIRECEAEGELTRLMTTLLAAVNLPVVLAFQIATHFIVTPSAPIWSIVRALGLPCVIGVSVGVAIAYWGERADRAAERQLVTLASIITMAGVCGMLELSLLLAALVAGVVVVNASPHERRTFEEIERIDYPFYVVFFALGGASLHFDLLPSIGVVGITYVGFRLLAKMIGNAAGTKLGSFGTPIERWLGVGMLAQAGLAIGFAAQLEATWTEHGRMFQTIILASVLVFEIIGPILTRLSLVRSGDVAVLALVNRRAPVGVFEGVHEVLEHFRSSLGIPRWHAKPGGPLVEHVMRRSVETMPMDMPFSKILHLLGHSRYDRWPVVDRQGRLVGQICYSEVANAIFDEGLSNLVVAGDLLSSQPLTLKSSDNLDVALRLFAERPDVTYVPVVAPDSPERLVGIVRHNDVLAARGQL